MSAPFVTGFTDGEGTLTVGITERKHSRVGFVISPVFKLVALNNPMNLHFFKEIKHFFKGIGNVSTSKNMLEYKVYSLKNLQIIKQHFLRYPLQTTKANNFYY